MSQPPEDQLNKKFFLKRPDGKKRKSFSISCYIPIDRKTKKYVDVPERFQADFDSINKKFKDKTIDQGEAEVLLDELIQSEYRKSKVKDIAIKAMKLSDANKKVFAKFWNEKYEIKDHADAGKSAKHDFTRAFKAIEPLSIHSASQLELQKSLKKNLSNTRQIRRASERLNEVLKWLEREFVLVKPRKGIKTVIHLSKNDTYKLLPHIECEKCRLLAESLFATGMRIGESMVLKDSDLSGLELRISKQRVNYGKKEEKLPKREKTGTVVVFEFGLKALKEWIAVEDKWAHRDHFNEQLKKACKAAKLQRITAHCLRHSHAIYILSAEVGGTLTDVSFNLRDRIEVCQEYYVGYSHNEGTLDRLKRLTSNSSKK